MIVGVAVVEIHVHESQSLKAKRGVVRSIIGRLRNKFNVSVGEVGGQGTWQRATIGLSMTGSDEVALRRALQKAVAFVEQTHLAQVIDHDLEIIRMPLTAELSGEQGLPTEFDEDLPWGTGLGERSPDRGRPEETEE
jgi:uncharacterized protein YlxP (DUF503 family)